MGARSIEGMRVVESESKGTSKVLGPLRFVLLNRELLMLLICSVLLGLSSSFWAPFMSMFGTLGVGMSPALFGVFMTVTTLSGVVISTLLAKWSDTHISRRSLLVLSSLSGALGYVGYAYLRSVPWLMVDGCILVGISTVGFSQLFAQARERLMALGISPTDAPLYMNIYRLAFALAWTVGPAAAAWILQRYSYVGLFLGAAFACVALALAAPFAMPDSKPHGSRNAQVEADEAPGSLREALTRPDLLGYFVGFVMVFTATTMGMTGVPLLVLGPLHGTESQVGIIFSLAPVFELPLMYLFGMLASGGDQERLIRFSVFLAVIYFGLLSMVRAPWQIYPLQILSAAITAVVSGVAITFFQNHLPNHPGTATGLHYNANRLGSTVGYLLFGTVANLWGYRVVLVVSTLLCVITLGIFMALKDRKPVAA